MVIGYPSTGRYWYMLRITSTIVCIQEIISHHSGVVWIYSRHETWPSVHVRDSGTRNLPSKSPNSGQFSWNHQNSVGVTQRRLWTLGASIYFQRICNYNTTSSTAACQLCLLVYNSVRLIFSWSFWRFEASRIRANDFPASFEINKRRRA